jgi:hypothetical protein
MAIEAAEIFTSAVVTCARSRPPMRRSSAHVSAAALKSAAIVVPRASPVKPMTRTSTRLKSRFTVTEPTLMAAGIRLLPSE